ncbi:MAG TPA: VPDSG-CTERM sorting domain-containing protein [Lacunisphaera sp.]|nr:VPDSG-CTERM sorting domain-containing protein [Lacunisphaera sp.]
MKSFIKLAGLIALVGCLLSKANATVYDFTFTNTVSYAETPGINVGDTFVLHLFADNGGSSLNSQTWTLDDTLGFTIDAGSYSATYSLVWPFGFMMQTDSTGALVTTSFFGTSDSSNNTDNFGSWVGDYVFGNAEFHDRFNRRNNISANSFNDTRNWTVGLASAVPDASSTLSFLGMAVLGLVAFVRRK